MNIKENDFNDLAFCAFRYALGRQTYIVEIVSNILIKYKLELTLENKESIVEEILKTNEYGRVIDKECWIKLLHSLQDKEPLGFSNESL